MLLAANIRSPCKATICFAQLFRNLIRSMKRGSLPTHQTSVFAVIVPARNYELPLLYHQEPAILQATLQRLGLKHETPVLSLTPRVPEVYRLPIWG